MRQARSGGRARRRVGAIFAIPLVLFLLGLTGLVGALLVDGPADVAFSLAAAGLVLGARVPVILNSRADDDMSRLASCAVAALHHARMTGGHIPS